MNFKYAARSAPSRCGGFFASEVVTNYRMSALQKASGLSAVCATVNQLLQAN